MLLVYAREDLAESVVNCPTKSTLPRLFANYLGNVFAPNGIPCATKALPTQSIYCRELFINDCQGRILRRWILVKSALKIVDYLVDILLTAAFFLEILMVSKHLRRIHRRIHRENQTPKSTTDLRGCPFP